MRHIALALLFLTAGTPVLAQEGPAILEPEQIGQIFCLARLGNDMAPIEALLTEDLAGAIDEALYRSGEIEVMNPGEKPPLGDGIPWQSSPDYAPQCTVAKASYEMNEARVWIDYAFPDQPEENFTDTLHLRLVEGRSGWNVWRLDNIGYADGDLKTMLLLAFME